MNKKVHVKKGDKVLVLSGKNKGKKAKVIAVLPSNGRVLVEGVNMVKKHKKPRSQREQGGILDQEGAIDASKVMLICNKCDQPARVTKKVHEDGTKARECKKCKEIIDVIKEAKE